MQEPQRLLARLNPITVDWKHSIRVTGEILKAEDVAACLAGLDRGPYLLALYLWSGDESVTLELYSLLFVEAKNLAVKYNWRCKNEFERLFALIKMAMHELKKVNICNLCKGTGVKLHNTCDACYGDGKKRRTQTEYARICGVKVPNWKKCWDYKYNQILMILIDWEELAINHMLSKL